MRLIIDVYNAIHAWLGLGAAGPEPSVRSMADLIGHSRYGGRPATLVCDGVSRAGQPARTPLAMDRSRLVTVIYAGPGRDADSLIEEFIEKSSAPRGLAVVSSDRRIIRAARRRRAKAIESAPFILELLGDAERAEARARSERPAPGASRGEVAEWMRYFGLSPAAHGLDGQGDDDPPADAPPTERELLAGFDEADLDMARWIEDDPGSGGG